VLATGLVLGNGAAADTAAGLAALEQGRTAEAIALLEASPDDPGAQLALARLYEPTDLDEAGKWVEKALGSQPDSAEAHYLMGVIRGRQAQNATFAALRLARKSKEAFERAVALAPDSPVYLNGLVTFHLNAPSIAGGDLDDAQRLAERLADLDPIQGVLAQANIAQARGDEDGAIGRLERGLAENGEDPLLAYNAGLLHQNRGDYERAFRYFETASRGTDGTHGITRYAALYQLGRTAVFSGSHVQQGIEALTTYLDDAPVHADLVGKSWAEFRLALLYEQDDRADDARTIFARLQNAEDDRLRREVRKKL
jgi:tetratricopeptide (TPR) repeat protein